MLQDWRREGEGGRPHPRLSCKEAINRGGPFTQPSRLPSWQEFKIDGMGLMTACEAARLGAEGLEEQQGLGGGGERSRARLSPPPPAQS